MIVYWLCPLCKGKRGFGIDNHVFNKNNERMMHKAKKTGIFLLCILLSSCALGNLGSNISYAILSEPDPEIAKQAIPSFIKITESLMLTWPDNQGYATNTASLYILYALTFLDGEAWYLEDSNFEEWMELKSRAMDMYEQAFSILRPFIEKKSPGLLSDSFDPESKAAKAMTGKFGKKDIPLLYYTAASVFAAFSSSPMAFEVSARLPAALAMLERALELDRNWNKGALLELAWQVSMAMPQGMSNAFPDTDTLYEEALKLGNGLSAGLYVNYALLYCVSQGDRDAFTMALDQATSIRPQQAGDMALLNAIARKKAAFLLEHIEDYFF